MINSIPTRRIEDQMKIMKNTKVKEAEKKEKD